ncbi:hypothetical protein BpHYR1_031625 [Brachionus plicatilis]|uniref:Uncharacterized protein n=1 Tax=Brachionus plicatilis TaxID=10195 RepID=A0A3M7S4W2_BRAPC|nr:hypothetical protein BpHYR1_031625 [Brachionus plicatilis]
MQYWKYLLCENFSIEHPETDSSTSTVELDFTTLSGSLFKCGTTLFEKNTCLALTAAAKSFLI